MRYRAIIPIQHKRNTCYGVHTVTEGCIGTKRQFRRDNSIYKRETESDMVAGTDRVCSRTGKGTFMENHLPMDIRKVFGEREPESCEEKERHTRGKKPEANTISGSPYGRETRAYTAEKKRGIGKRIQW